MVGESSTETPESMQRTPFRNALAILLCVQPVFWTSGAALAQTMEQPGGLAPPWIPGASPAAPGDREASEEIGRGGRPGAAFPSGAAQPLPLAPAIDEPVDPDKYLCGPGDVLELNFWGLQNFKLRVAVDLEGRAFVPKVGYFALQGKTLSEARRIMRESVARYFPSLSFDVALAEPRTFLVQLVDDVPHPGSYPARAVDRVGTLIARTGGFGPRASRRLVEIKHRDGSSSRADLLLFQLTGDVRHNPRLLDGDVVHVPFEGMAASISGAVNRSGRYELVGPRDLAELVGLAGGLAPTATRLLPIAVVRRSPDDRQDLRLVTIAEDGSLPELALQQEDSVIVPSDADLRQSVMVIGALAGVPPPEATGPAAAGGAARGTPAEEASSTRRLPFVKGDTVRTLLERVGGVGPLADLKGSYVLRRGQSVPVDLHALVMLRDLTADRAIELGDVLVVPFMRRSILVEGAVFAPGAYPYNPNYGVQQYLSLAGGLNRFARPLSDVKLVTPNGETKEFTSELKVEPGSSLVVPERNFSRAEVVQIALGIATVLVSGVAVVLAARK
jgi:protein involved in polysaccharide export with SLBB domain